uniref:RNA binding motif protein 12B n=1 Tax=Pundamilia nyererei TaxID=303518 RepID=A0A3B4GRT5_9CICH
MTIILRLKGLDAKAGIEDIRAFFGSVRIPDGGVCIVGGRLQEAFIAFNTEREAQLAMRLTGNVLKGSKVTLHISKMEELEHRLETVLKEKKKQTLNSQPGYVRLFGLPPSTTKDDICHFFRGLTVQEAIVNVRLGLNHGCLVKFATMQDASAALNFNQQSLGPFCVDVRGACEKIWNSALQEFDSESGTPAVEYIVMVSNLPKTMTKTEIKELFGCATIPHKNVLHLLDKEGNRTDTAFLLFNRTEDFDYAMNLTGCHVGSNTITVSPITKEAMREKMSKMHLKSLKHRLKPKDPRTKPNLKRKSGLVDKDQIKSLFSKYKIKKDNIALLRNSEGSGIGEAVIQFKSKKLAALAQRLHGKDFLGTKVLLTCITMRQMEDILNDASHTPLESFI